MNLSFDPHMPQCRALVALPVPGVAPAATPSGMKIRRRPLARDVALFFAVAEARLLSLVGRHADDALAGFHLRRLLNGAKGVRMQLA